MKKYLLSLLIFFGLGLSFCSAGSYTYSGTYTGSNCSYTNIIVFNLPVIDIPSGKDFTISCSFSNVSYSFPARFGYGSFNKQYGNASSNVRSDYDFSIINGGTAYYNFNVLPSNLSDYILYVSFYGRCDSNSDYSFDYSCTFSGENIIDVPICPECPSQYTSEECQSEYGLITTGSVNQEFCLDYNLCPVNTGSWSNIFVNDIRFQSMPFIYLTIPEEIDWDYQLTDFSLDIDIGGYNTDSEYIENIINTQKSKPTEEDLSNLFFGVFPLLFPGFIFILFLYFAFKLIKKIF